MTAEENKSILGTAAKLLADPNVKSVVFTKNRKNVRKKLKLVQVDADGNEVTKSITKYLER